MHRLLLLSLIKQFILDNLHTLSGNLHFTHTLKTYGFLPSTDYTVVMTLDKSVQICEILTSIMKNESSLMKMLDIMKFMRCVYPDSFHNLKLHRAFRDLVEKDNNIPKKNIWDHFIKVTTFNICCMTKFRKYFESEMSSRNIVSRPQALYLKCIHSDDKWLAKLLHFVIKNTSYMSFFSHTRDKCPDIYRVMHYVMPVEIKCKSPEEITFL